MTKQDNTEIFLREFVARIVKEKANKMILEKKENSLELEKKEKEIKKEKEEIKTEIKKPENTLPRIQRVLLANKPKIKPKVLPRAPPPKLNRPAMPPIIAPNMPTLNKGAVVEQLNFKSLDKLKIMINDPAVISIECSGPGKNIIVNSGGSMKATNISLTQDEINAIMRDISEKTKIPLTTGVFKAVVGRYLVTAVVSEFAGTRFIITKRTPSTKY